MRLVIDNSSKKKHYVEKDNYFLIENDELLTIKTYINGDISKSRDIFEMFCYFLDFSPAEKRAYKVILNNNGIYVNKGDLCEKAVKTFGGNQRSYYAPFHKLLTLGVMVKDKDGFFRVGEKYDITKYKNVKGIMFKLNN